MNNIKLVGLKEPIPVSQIMYVIEQSNYANVYTVNGKCINDQQELAFLGH